MKAMNQRQMKVAEEIRHLVARALLRGDIASRIDTARVTITDVWASADLRLARLYVALPAGADEAAWLAALNHEVATPLRKVLAKQLATKYIPELSFWPTENAS